MEQKDFIEAAAKGTTAGLLAPVTDMLKQFVGYPLTELFGIAGDEIYFFRLKNQYKILLKAEKFISDMGIDEPAKVPLKTIMPLLKDGSMEENETLQDKWAALLANAVNPKYNHSYDSIFFDILSKLTTAEAILLDKLYEAYVYYDSMFIEVSNIQGIEDIEIEMILHRLVKLDLIDTTKGKRDTFITLQVVEDYEFALSFTPVGLEFIKRCRVEI